MSDEKPGKPKFPRAFWAANTIELFERAAYYSMASFMVIYLKESLGMRPTFATFLNGSLLWGLIYFMPIVSGTLADKYGYKRSLTLSFVLIGLGYFTMGNLQRFWPGLIGQNAAEAIDYTIPVILGIVLIGIGGSIVKPCIAGTVQKTSGTDGHGRFRDLLHGHQHRFDHRPRRLLFHPDEPRHPGHLHLRVLRLRPDRPGRRPLHLQRTAIRERRTEGRPGGPEKDAGTGPPRDLRRPQEREIRLFPRRHRPLLGPLRPALQPHAALPPGRGPQRAHGALHPGQSGDDRQLSSSSSPGWSRSGRPSSPSSSASP